jgi:hypothetical protein
MQLPTLMLLRVFSFCCFLGCSSAMAPMGSSVGSTDSATRDAPANEAGSDRTGGNSAADAIVPDGTAGAPGADAAADAVPADAAPAAGACLAIAALDRACAVDADCLAVPHVASCCGQIIFMGIRVSENARFQDLELACKRSYLPCGCPPGLPTAQDGSLLAFTGPAAGVTCLRGTCTTFAPACGHVCEGGRSCFACSDHLTLYASCSTRCTTDGDCKDPNVTTCQDSPTGRFCTAAGIACNAR